MNPAPSIKIQWVIKYIRCGELFMNPAPLEKFKNLYMNISRCGMNKKEGAG